MEDGRQLLQILKEVNSKKRQRVRPAQSELRGVIYYVFTKSTPDLIATFTGEIRTQSEAHNT